MKYNTLKYYSQELEIENTHTAGVLLHEREQNTRLACLQDLCDFNVFHTLGLLGWHKDFQRFLLKNAQQIKRRLTLNEFFDYAEVYRRKPRAKTLKDLIF